MYLPFVTSNLKLWAGYPLVQRLPVRDVPLESLAGSFFQVGHLWDQFCSHPFNYYNKFTFGYQERERKSVGEGLVKYWLSLSEGLQRRLRILCTPQQTSQWGGFVTGAAMLGNTGEWIQRREDLPSSTE